jgi:hypothetical protein
MNSFFESEIVIKEIREIENLKNEITLASLKILSNVNPSEEEKNSFFDMLSTLIEKQQIFLNRVYFSDDKEALEVKEFYENILSNVNSKTGKTLTLNEYFQEAIKQLEELKNTL